MDGGVNVKQPWVGGPRGFLSASLLNARKLPHGLYHGGPGLVISPHSKLLCSYPQDSGSKSWQPPKVTIAGCGPRLCTSADAPFPDPSHDHGYPCAFPPEMFESCLQVFDNVTVETSAYTEVVFAVADNAYAIDAVIDPGDTFGMHAALLARYGIKKNQLPLVQFGPGLKGAGPLFIEA